MTPRTPSSQTDAALDARPWLVALLILFGSAWFVPTEASLVGGAGMPLNVLWFVWLAALFGLIGFRVTNDRLANLSGWAWADRLWMLYFAWHTLSVLLGWYFQWLEPRPALGLMWQQLALAAVYVGGRLLCRSETARGLVVKCLVALAISLSLFAWYQYLVVLPELHDQYMRAEESEKVAQLLGAGITDTTPGSRMRELFESRLFNREPFATFSLANTLGAILVPATLLALLNFVGQWRHRRWGLASLWGMAGVLIVTAISLTSSRTALVALGITVVLWLIRQFRFATRLDSSGRLAWAAAGLLVGLPLVLVIGLWAVGQSDSRLFSGAPQSVQYRLQYWISSSQMIAARPVFGWGPGNFQSAYAGFQAPEASETVADPHNFFFEIAATAGLPAGLAFLAAVSLAVYHGRATRVQRLAQVPKLARREVASFDDSIWSMDGQPLGVGRWPVWLVLPVGTGLGLAFGWLGESWPTPVLFLLIAVLIATSWWFALDEVEKRKCESVLETKMEAVQLEAVRWALLGLVLSLLASGGVNYPVIGSSLVLLAAMSVASVPERQASLEHGFSFLKVWRHRRTWQVAAAALAGLATYMYFYDTLPVIRSEWAMQRGRMQLATGNLVGGQYDLQMAEQLDPWRADTRIELAILNLISRRNELGNDRIRMDVVSQLRSAATFRPWSSSTRRRFAEAYLQVSVFQREESLRRESLESAKSWIEEALSRKPVDAGLAAQLSWLYDALGAKDQSREMAEKVQRLGLLNRHPDLQLGTQSFLAVESAVPADLLPGCSVPAGSQGLVVVNVQDWIDWVGVGDVTAK